MTVDPQTNLNNFIQQWQQANAQYATDYAYLAQMIQQMIALAKQGGNGVEEAFQIAQTAVMPGSMTVQGDTMGQLAASMNLGSACQEFTTDAQNNANGAGKVTPDQGDKFVKYIQQLYDDLQKELKLPKDQQWMDPNTANNILSALDKVSQEFGAQTPDDPNFNGATVASLLNSWEQNPTSQSGVNNDTGQQHIQNLQSGMQQWNNAESAQSQSLTAQEQFASNIYNQYMSACTTVLKSSQDQEQMMVSNLKSR